MEGQDVTGTAKRDAGRQNNKNWSWCTERQHPLLVTSVYLYGNITVRNALVQ